MKHSQQFPSQWFNNDTDAGGAPLPEKYKCGCADAVVASRGHQSVRVAVLIKAAEKTKRPGDKMKDFNE